MNASIFQRLFKHAFELMKKQSFIIRYSKALAATALVSMTLVCSVPSSAADPETKRAEQRELFRKAEYAAKRGRLAEYRTLLKQLGDYPLKPYLELERLQQVGYLANEQRVLSFLEQYEGTPLDWQLRRPWLTYLASQGEEQRFIRDFRHPGTLTHRCQLITAERNQGLADAPFIKKVDAQRR